MRRARSRAPWGMGSSFTFLNVGGISIGAHWSWLVVFVLVVSSLARTILPQTYPGWADGTYLLLAVVAALLFFGSIVLHELGHALVATREGMIIDGISLWVFGGVARVRGPFRSPGTEFRVALAGPLVSAVLVGVFYAVAGLADLLGWAGPVAGTAGYLARINAILVAFNLVPALPLDGGRVLRAWLWYRWRDFAAATSWASRAGAVFGLVLSGIGVLGLLSGGPNGGVWLIVLGWFLTGAARGEASAAGLTQALEGATAGDAMTAPPVVVPAGTKVASFLADVVGERGHRAYPVVEGERLVGVVTLEAAGRVPVEERGTRSIDHVMTRPEQAHVFATTSDLMEAAEALQAAPPLSVVTDAGRVVGVLTPSDVRRLVATRAATRHTSRGAARRPGWGTLVVVAAAMLVAAAALYYPPLVVVMPGEALDVSRDITITGIPVDRPTGRYLLTSVRLERQSLLGVVAAGLSSDSDVVPASAVIPEGIDPRSFNAEQRQLFRQSRVLAAAAAARAAGMDVSITGDGAVVDELVPDSPAAGVLRDGDVIVAIGDRRVTTTDDVRAEIRSEPAGTRFRVEVERAGATRRLEVRSARLPGSPAPAIGVFIANRNLEVDLPFDVTFIDRPIGGPSAGLAFALAIADMVDEEDYARGRTIAVTGTIDVTGEVGGVGGVAAKTAAAEDAGATLLVVPDEEVAIAAGSDLEVLGVSTLEEALRLLEVRGA